MLKKLMSFIKGYKKETLLTPLFVTGEVILEVLIPYVMSDIIDVGIKNGDLKRILIAGAIMVTMAIVSLAFGVLAGRFAAVASVGFSKNIRRNLFYKVQDYSFLNIDKFSTSSLITRLTTDVTNVQNSYMMVLRIIFRAPIMLIAASIIAGTINLGLFCIFLAAIPVLAIGLFLIIKFAFPQFNNMLKKYDALNLKVQENLVGIRVVKAYVREDYETEQFKKASDELRRVEAKAEKLIVLNNPLMMLVMYSSIIALIWLGGIDIIAGGMQTGELFSFITYLSQILMSLMMISFIFVMLVLAKASAKRILEIMDEIPDINDDDADENLKVQKGSISFKNVSFKYGENSHNFVLENINLDIKPGETIGIIGGTGSSKSSLVQLIPRLYDISEGELLVDGHSVKEYKIENLRDSVAMVLQKNVLFSGTIKENLLWGNEKATDREIEHAMKVACAYDFVNSFPKGIETDLGQGGVNVSGGQKQRLCIARALLKNPKIMILDDSTSAVDTATDAKIREGLKNNFKDTTVIIIAQRVASVQDADRIIVMDDGKINAIGTNDELMKSNAIYKEIANSQKKGAEE